MSTPITLPATPEAFVEYQEQLIHRKLSPAEREVTAEWLEIFNDVSTGDLDGETASMQISFLINQTDDPCLLRFLQAALAWILAAWKEAQ